MRSRAGLCPARDLIFRIDIVSDVSDFIDFTQRASIGLTRRIESGTVRMGSRFHPREQPPRTVFVREFEIGHVPVTVNQFNAFVMAETYEQREWWSDAGWAWRQGDAPGWGRDDRSLPDGWKVQSRRFHHPVTGVTWHEANAYCRWIGKIKKKSVRLPTEEEWERAARGGDTRPFPWGEEFDAAFANTLESERGTTVGTGSLNHDASPYGVHDLAGNVQEWTASPYEPIPDEPHPPVPHIAVRGGSYNDTAFGARTSYRRGYPEGYFYPYLGFRIVVGMK
jgi:formylglycine-generating enzyme required for sulfatase activity